MGKQFWFKAKNYGWGWHPCSWQGWLILLVYIGYIIYLSETTQTIVNGSSSVTFAYRFETLFATTLLIIICFLTGEKPEWRWGGKKLK